MVSFYCLILFRSYVAKSIKYYPHHLLYYALFNLLRLADFLTTSSKVASINVPLLNFAEQLNHASNLLFLLFVPHSPSTLFLLCLNLFGCWCGSAEGGSDGIEVSVVFGTSFSCYMSDGLMPLLLITLLQR